MGLFWQNNNTNEEDYGELENMSAKLRQNLGELECEEDSKTLGIIFKVC